MFKRSYPVLFVAVAFLSQIGSAVMADPTVSNVSGIFSHKQTIIIAGSGWGIKSPAAPYFFDDFEGGVSGQNVVGKQGTVGGKTWQGYNGSPTYSNVNKYGQGSLSAYVQTAGDSFRTAGIDGLNSDIAYYSIRWRWGASSSNWQSAVYKPHRLTVGGGFYTPDPSFHTECQPGGGWTYNTVFNGTGYNQGDISLPSQNTWNRAEIYWVLSSTGGIARYWANGSLQMNLTNINTRASGYSSTKADSFLLPFQVANNGSNTYTFYADDVYFDTTQARVEIGNANSFAICTKREIQIPTAWSNNSISIIFNQGAFEAGQTAYVFVVDASGAANSTGFPIVIGGSGGGGGGGGGSVPPSSAPDAPGGLTVIK